MPPAPRRGQRIAAAVVAFAVFGAAAVLIADAFRDRTPATIAASDPATTVVVHLDAADGPSATLEYGGRTSQPQVGSYCWQGTQRCVDTALTPFSDADFVRVPSGTPITIDAPRDLTSAETVLSAGDNPGDWIRQTGPVVETDTVDGVPGKPYLLIVTSDWPQGAVQFFFPIEIVAGTSPTPSPESSILTAALDAPADGSMPDLVISYQDQTQTFFPQDGRWPGVDAFPIPLLQWGSSIDPGTTISIESDADRVQGTLFIADRDQRETGESIPLDLTSGSATLPDSAGYFRLVLVGTWPDGEAGFNVGITIGTPPSDWPPPAPSRDRSQRDRSGQA